MYFCTVNRFSKPRRCRLENTARDQVRRFFSEVDEAVAGCGAVAGFAEPDPPTPELVAVVTVGLFVMLDTFRLHKPAY